jgi:hypothetical protein
MKIPWTKSEITFVIKQYARGLSRANIARAFSDRFEKPRSLDSIKHCIDNHGLDVTKDLKRVLVVDIETKPMLANVWGLFDQNISLNQLEDEGGIFSWSAKWIGEKEVAYKDVKGNMKKEKQLLIPLWKMMDEADIIIGQNSNKFDIKKLNAKYLEYKLGAPSEYKKIDTMLLARRYFSFVSNKLEYMSKKFCKIKKLSHSKFPGQELWNACKRGNKQAWAEMKKYNIQDVLATEELFMVLSEFDKTSTTADAVRAYHAAKKSKRA